MHLITLLYFYCDIFAYVFRPVIRTIFRVIFLLREYSVSKCVKLFHVIEIHRLLVRNFCRMMVQNYTK